MNANQLERVLRVLAAGEIGQLTGEQAHVRDSMEEAVRVDDREGEEAVREKEGAGRPSESTA
jgi:hypothetical protein